MRSPAREPAARLSIGQLARRTGLNIETIRYYERIRVMPATPRTASGRRVFGESETRTLAFIRRARELGFSLGQIRTLLALSGAGGSETCAEARRLASDHLTEVQAKIADLKAMENVLAQAVKECDDDHSSGCPLIDALSRHL